ncbi:MAG: hypothetical protein F6K58_09665 [Symploca sp. SIO2E9]|nr:hypothetical protein [Symploca sp. SIO2E9]
MAAQLTITEIDKLQQVFQDYAPAQKALATLAAQDGRLEESFNELCHEEYGTLPQMPTGKSLWGVTLKNLRQELCGDDSFRTKVQEYSKNPGSTPLLTGLIVYLVGMAGLPLDPAIATFVVLYLLKVGFNIFCEYTEAAVDQDSRRIPHD